MYCIWNRSTAMLLKAVRADSLAAKFEFVKVEEAKCALSYSDKHDATQLKNALNSLVGFECAFEVVEVEEKTQFVITKFV